MIRIFFVRFVWTTWLWMRRLSYFQVLRLAVREWIVPIVDSFTRWWGYSEQSKTLVSWYRSDIGYSSYFMILHSTCTMTESLKYFFDKFFTNVIGLFESSWGITVTGCHLKIISRFSAYDKGCYFMVDFQSLSIFFGRVRCSCILHNDEKLKTQSNLWSLLLPMDCELNKWMKYFCSEMLIFWSVKIIWWYILNWICCVLTSFRYHFHPFQNLQSSWKLSSNSNVNLNFDSNSIIWNYMPFHFFHS
jgi:hypothetical protein